MQQTLTTRRDMLASLLVLPLAATCAAAQGATAPATAPAANEAATRGPGTHTLLVAEPSGATASPMKIHYHRPPDWRSGGRSLVVLHGTGRDAERYLADWRDIAEAAQVLLIVPEFDTVKFPGRRYYNFGNVVDERMQPRTPDKWVFGAIDRAYQQVKRDVGATRDTYALYGHSAGAQFVHRYLLLSQASNAEIIITANAGSYTIPVDDVPFPWGLKNTAVGETELRRAFARPVVVLLGGSDTDPEHPSLPRDAAAKAQGAHRLARGTRFFETCQWRAKELSTPLAWRLITVPGVGHSDRGMAPAALRLVLESKA